MKTMKYVVAILSMISFCGMCNAQSEIYPQHFNLNEVTLLDGPFRKAMVLNDSLLLEYDYKRFMTGFIATAGLDKQEGKYYNWSVSHPDFSNWGRDFMAGHYVSALSIAYASCDDAVMKRRLEERLDECLDILHDCQEAFKTDNIMYGFLCHNAVSDMWRKVYNGDLNAYWNGGDFYTMHKNLNGLRDSWIYAGKSQGRDMFEHMCDWLCRIFNNATTATMQPLLDAEHGGVNESMIDAYRIFGKSKYITCARKLCHEVMITNFQTLNTTYLDGLHANTQVPKFVGFERIYQEEVRRGSGVEAKYRKAAHNFFADVNNNRTVCIGGNSISEHFLAKDNCAQYIDNLEGPESCNSYNMMKLEECLFDETHDAQYVDAYENTMWNHILATQDPNTGGYVYFTPLRPQAYRIYSQVNQGMWCCVGTGMENHGKYGQFIYTHSLDSTVLYVNLFTASKLNSDKFNVTQETKFPYEPSTKIIIGKAGEYTLAVRHPSWVGEDFAVKVNGELQSLNVTVGVASYVEISREWNEGDVVEVSLPMSLRYEECPNYGRYVAFKYGPILLAAQTTATSVADAENTGLKYENLPNQYADDSRWGHSEGAYESPLSIASSPLLICDRENVIDSIHATESPMDFVLGINGDYGNGKWSQLHLRPFFEVQNCRYMIYWYQQDIEGYKDSGLGNQDVQSRTIDGVDTGVSDSEETHKAQYTSDSNTGVYYENYRDAQKNGYVQYTLFNNDNATENVSLLCRLLASDGGRNMTVYVDGVKLLYFVAPKAYRNQDSNGFYNVEFPIPSSYMTNEDGTPKTEITVNFKSTSTMIPGLYYVRLMRNHTSENYKFVANDWNSGDVNRVAQSNFAYNTSENNIVIKAGTGTNNVCLHLNTDSTNYNVSGDLKYLLVMGTNLSTVSSDSYLWWLNGMNKASSVAPTSIKTTTDGQTIIAWRLSSSNIDENCQGDLWNLCSGYTCFGLTSTTGTSTINYIGFVKSVNDFINTVGIEGVEYTSVPQTSNVYSASGVLIYKNVSSKDIINKLPRGLYIIDGKKFIK